MKCELFDSYFQLLGFFSQVAAETAHDMVSPSSSVNGMPFEKRHSKSSSREQPVDLREGVTNAYNVLSEVTVRFQLI